MWSALPACRTRRRRRRVAKAQVHSEALACRKRKRRRRREKDGSGGARGAPLPQAGLKPTYEGHARSESYESDEGDEGCYEL